MSRFFGPLRPDWLTGRHHQEHHNQPGRQHHGRQPARITQNPPVGVYMNAVYYPNYRIYRQQPPSSLNLGCISHIFYAFAW
jgi:hypothetical protein